MTEIVCGPTGRINYNVDFGSIRGRILSNSQNHLKLDMATDMFK